MQTRINQKAFVFLLESICVHAILITFELRHRDQPGGLKKYSLFKLMFKI